MTCVKVGGEERKRGGKSERERERERENLRGKNRSVWLVRSIFRELTLFYR